MTGVQTCALPICTANVPLAVGVMKEGVDHAVNPITQHGLAFQMQDTKRMTCIKIFTGLQLVSALLGEQIWPAADVVAVQNVRILLLQHLYLVEKIEVHML